MPDVVIYSRSWCGYCTRAKALLARKGVTFTRDRDRRARRPRGTRWWREPGGGGQCRRSSSARRMSAAVTTSSSWRAKGGWTRC